MNVFAVLLRQYNSIHRCFLIVSFFLPGDRRQSRIICVSPCLSDWVSLRDCSTGSIGVCSVCLCTVHQRYNTWLWFICTTLYCIYRILFSLSSYDIALAVVSTQFNNVFWSYRLPLLPFKCIRRAPAAGFLSSVSRHGWHKRFDLFKCDILTKP
jgi:hypothetical protein